MTNKQKNILYYRIEGYTPRQCAIIAGVSDSYARRIINNTEEVDLQGFTPDVDCITRRTLIDHIYSGIGYIYVPNTQKYGYISLLGYLGMTYSELHILFPEDQSQFIYMALHRSNKAWRDLDPGFMGITIADYKFLLKIR